MLSFFLQIYEKLILRRPWLTLLATLTVVGLFAWQIPNFKLDASGDSLTLENDTDLHYHRRIVERYGTSDILVIPYTARQDLFAAATLADLKALRNELRQLPGVDSVTTILDVPQLISTGISLGDLADEEKIKTLEDRGVDRKQALLEFRENPLYQGRLLSADAKTTALLINLPQDEPYRELLKRRYELREKRYDKTLTPAEAEELAQVSLEYRRHLSRLQQEEKILVSQVREVMARHHGAADLYLGGVPMIVVDMISFIRKDLAVFGLGVLFFLIITLTIIFKKTRWVILAIFCCSTAVLTMIGYLGMVDWRVTVISSNFISLMLILTMSLSIHLIQRYTELQARLPEADQKALVLETVRTIVLPCLYAVLTTMVAFVSLLVSGIRPVMDFGMMMTIGLIVSFTLAFLLFPATVLLLKKDTAKISSQENSKSFTLVFARLTEAHGNKILAASILLAIFSGLGITKLKVDNRFIDYFREKTAIYQGMSLIDQKLGGTTPLDLIIDFRIDQGAVADFEAFAEDDEFFKDDELFADEMGEPGAEEPPPPWFANIIVMEEIEEIHDFLADLSETGEVLSLATVGKLATRLNNDMPLDGVELALLYNKAPADIKAMLMSPFVSEDITQARFTMRIIESDKKLERKALLAKIRNFLEGKMKLAPEQIHFTSMFVLYNNMLQSLFKSQILTIGVVFLGIMLMFTFLFRSLYLAIIAIIPNLLPAALVLGTMGWAGIPLDLMTITIASITIGIAVDDTIHYIHRFQREFKTDRNYLAAMYRCHNSIGRAMFYTSITITIGFSILVLSNFIPTIYFGLFTGFAMMMALLAALTLLPKLIVMLKPLGPEGQD